MSTESAFFVCNLGNRITLMKVELLPGVEAPGIFRNIADARKLAHEAADYLGVELDDETALRLVQ